MKKNLYSLLILFVAFLGANTTIKAQCGDRYKEPIFSAVTKTAGVEYSNTDGSLLMDIYEPTGDTATMRPLIVLAHGGSFIGGDRTESTIVQLCNKFAKRGYVTASIEYRLGAPLSMLDSTYAITTVLKALSDGKSAIRFFRKDAATTNTYKINPNLIYAGGNSAGAVLYMHAVYVDSTGELTPFLQNIINANGGFEGNSGNAGYSSDINALINLAGGLNDPNLVSAGGKPSVNFQGNQDNTVPYNCANAVSGSIQVRLCGLGAIEPLYNQYGIYHSSTVYPGSGHVPWESSQAIFTQVDTVTANFLYTLLCPEALSVNELSKDNQISVYPNPTSSVINVSVAIAAAYTTVQLIDQTGKVVSEKPMDATTVSFNRNNLSAGLYLVRLVKNDFTSVVKKVIIE